MKVSNKEVFTGADSGGEEQITDFVREAMAIAESARGELLIIDHAKRNWWMIPTNGTPVDTAQVEADCQSICDGKFDQLGLLVPILEHPNGQDCSCSSDPIDRCVGVFPFGLYRSDLGALLIDPCLAGPENLHLLGMQVLLADLPKAVAGFHLEIRRVSSKLSTQAAHLRQLGDHAGWLLAHGAIDTIQGLKCYGVWAGDDDPASIEGDIWPVLIGLCRKFKPEHPDAAVWLHLAAGYCDDVYIPVPDALVSELGDEPSTRLLLQLVHLHNGKSLRNGLEQERSSMVWSGKRL